MVRHVYYIQPTYRKMDGKLARGWTLFNASLNIPMLSAVTPANWFKSFCLEYFDDIDYSTEASVIFLTSMGYDIRHSMEIAEYFRARGKVVVFGGHSDDFTDVLMKRVCDSVFYGIPGKDEMKVILEDAYGGTLKESYHCGVNINYPFDYTVFGNRRMRHLPVLASAGCKHCCEFCCYPIIYKGKYHLRDISHVLEDLKFVRSKTRIVAFKDANLYNDRRYLLDLCQAIRKAGLKLKWGAQCTINVGNDSEVLKELRAAGCRMLFIGYESLNKRNIRGVAKPADPDNYERFTSRIRKAGIHVVGYFILGLDHDRLNSFERIYSFVHRTRIALPLINLLIPIPGSRIHRRLKEQNRLAVPNEQVFLEQNPLYSVPCNRALFKPLGFSPDELEKNFTDLAERLTQIPEIIYRSAVKNPFEALQLFKMNWDLRKEHRKLLRAEHL